MSASARWRAQALGLMLMALVAAAQAAPMMYLLQFTGASVPASGIVIYDSAAQQFSLLGIGYNGAGVDLTAAANAPQTGTSCPGATSSAATSWALLNKIACNGLDHYWSAFQTGTLTSFSFFGLASGLHPVSISGSASGDELNALLLELGDWSLTPVTDYTGGIVALIEFDGFGDRPDFGYMVYDDAAQRFDAFAVRFDGAFFDLTDEANTPDVGPACAGLGATAMSTWALMNQQLCDGLLYRWSAIGTGGTGRDLSFDAYTPPAPSLTGLRIHESAYAGADGLPIGAGEWRLTIVNGEPNAVPAPSTAALLVVALGALAVGRRSRHHRRADEAARPALAVNANSAPGCVETGPSKRGVSGSTPRPCPSA